MSTRAPLPTSTALKGVGPAMSQRILDARKQSAFKDWPDLMSRVKGVKAKAATKLSAEGLTVNGQSFRATPPRPTEEAPRPRKPRHTKVSDAK